MKASGFVSVPCGEMTPITDPLVTGVRLGGYLGRGEFLKGRGLGVRGTATLVRTWGVFPSLTSSLSRISLL